MAADLVDGNALTRVVGFLFVVAAVLAGCSFGSDLERETATRVKIVGFDEVDRSAYLQKDTYYVEIVLDATKEEVLGAADSSAILSTEDFEELGQPGVFGFLLGSFADRENGCQVIVLLEPFRRTTVRVGVVCNESGSAD